MKELEVGYNRPDKPDCYDFSSANNCTFLMKDATYETDTEM